MESGRKTERLKEIRRRENISTFIHTRGEKRRKETG